MRHRPLPGTDLRVSEIGLAAAPFARGWWGDGDEEAIRLVHAALDRGVTLFDAAAGPVGGRAEAVLGRALAGRRDGAVVAAGTRGRADGRGVREDCERTLRRLGAEAVDLYLLEDPPPAAAARGELAGALDALVADGLVRAWGVAVGGRPEGARAALEAGRARVVAADLDLLDPEPGRGVAALASERGSAALARAPHAAGLLEGKYTAETAFPPWDPRAARSREWLVEGLRRVDALRFLTEDRPHTLGQAALRWALSQGGVAAAVAEIHTTEQLEEFARAADLPDLIPDDLARIEALRAAGFGAEAGPAEPLRRARAG